MTTIQILVEDGTIRLTVSKGEFSNAEFLSNEETIEDDIFPNWIEVDEEFCAYRGIEIK